jgi:hypothetical protein
MIEQEDGSMRVKNMNAYDERDRTEEKEYCPWCGQEIETCRYNWERFHTDLLDPYCYDNWGNVVGVWIPGEGW